MGMIVHRVWRHGERRWRLRASPRRVAKRKGSRVGHPQTQDPQTQDPQTQDPQTQDPQTQDPQTQDPQTRHQVKGQPRREHATERLPLPTPANLVGERERFVAEVGHKPSPDAVDDEGMTDLHYAAKLNLPALTLYLLSLGAAVDARNDYRTGPDAAALLRRIGMLQRRPRCCCDWARLWML